MSCGALRSELKARHMNHRGLKSQLVARLTKALKIETDRTEADNQDKESSNEADMEGSDEKKDVR